MGALIEEGTIWLVGLLSLILVHEATKPHQAANALPDAPPSAVGNCPQEAAPIKPQQPGKPGKSPVPDTGGAATPPEDDDRLKGAQAPGKPTADDGYTPPKRWDGNKVRSPNGRGYGWPAKDGSVWVPTGPGSDAQGRPHGGPHWDVQYPDGSRKNILPGGKER